jgi:predicted enzyme related to lactoylglutathione lyase
MSETFSKTHGKFIWCELMVPDVDAAIRFYGHVVGWNARDFGMEGMPYTIFEADGAGVAGLMQLTEEFKEQGIPPNWTGYVAVDDVDATAEAFSANGGSVRRPPDDIPGVGRFAVVADPHGAVLCIMTPAPMENPPAEKPMTTPGHVGWHELYAGDGPQAFEFYEKLFGWTKDHDFDMGAMGVYRIFAEHGTVTGGMMTKTAQTPFACWGYYFNVEAIDAAVTRVSTGGGKVVNGPMEVPGDSWVVNCIDPQGAFFSLLAPKR